MKRCVIVGGAKICDYKRIKGLFLPDDFFVFCDGGLNHAEKLGVRPSLIVGDFDSFCPEKLSDFSETEIIKLPREKDDTDTFFAIKTAYSRGFRDFLLAGASGGRFDHTFGNVSALLWLHERNCTASLADDFCLMQVAGKEKVFVEDSFSYFSVIACFGRAGGVFIENAKYPLENAALECDFQLGISNEVLKGNSAAVRCENGAVLVVKVF